MTKPRRLPVALTIAGSDSGGGAGIQADLKTFAALGVHGTSVVTCLTAQNPAGIFGVQGATARLIRRQIQAIFSELPPAAIKTGMLYSRDIIGAVVNALPRGSGIPLVVDPVLIATSGARLLRPDALRELQDHLLPRASLVTPNLDEAELLLERRIRDEDDLRKAARDIFKKFGCPALVKGGHLRLRRRPEEAVDAFYDGQVERSFSAAYVRGISTHGTGCTYAAAIAGHCARGESLPTAVRKAKTFITQAIRHSQRIGRHWVLGWG